MNYVSHTRLESSRYATDTFEKIAGGDLMGIDRRKIENRYKSGNKYLTTWSFNLGFSCVHHRCSTGHRVKFQLFWIGILFFKNNFEIYYK